MMMDNYQQFYLGPVCPKTALYGQFYGDNHYAGRQYERKFKRGQKFPSTQQGYYFKKTLNFT